MLKAPPPTPLIKTVLSHTESKAREEWTYPYLYDVFLSSCSGMSSGCVPAPHVRRTRRFAQTVCTCKHGKCTHFVPKSNQPPHSRCAHSRAPVGELRGSLRVHINLSVRVVYRTTSARSRIFSFLLPPQPRVGRKALKLVEPWWWWRWWWWHSPAHAVGGWRTLSNHRVTNCWF